jgi:hypothetical protein
MEQFKKVTLALKNGIFGFLQTFWAIGTSVVAGDVLLKTKARNANKVHISERGWCSSSRGFSHRRSVLADMNALRNPLRNMYQPLPFMLKKEKQPTKMMISQHTNSTFGFCRHKTLTRKTKRAIFLPTHRNSK